MVPIYWDAHFRNSPPDVAVFDEFLRTLFRSSWMTQLGRQGVLPARLLPSFVPRRVAPARLGATELREQLREWKDSGLVTALPQTAELFQLLVVPAHLQKSLESAAVKQCVVVPLIAAGSHLLEDHSLAISRALAASFVQALADHTQVAAQEDLETRNSRQTTARVLLGVGGVLVATGAVLLVFNSRSTPQSKAVVTSRPGGATLSFERSF